MFISRRNPFLSRVQLALCSSRPSRVLVASRAAYSTRGYAGAHFFLKFSFTAKEAPHDIIISYRLKCNGGGGDDDTTKTLRSWNASPYVSTNAYVILSVLARTSVARGFPFTPSRSARSRSARSRSPRRNCALFLSYRRVYVQRRA